MLRIGPYTIDAPVVLAPMAGVTDRPFRRLCRQMGAGLVVSEMVTADTRLWHTRKSQQRLPHADEPEPRAIQIAGGDPDMLAEAAKANVALGAQIIDINMGCPAKKVCKKAAGSALLKDEGLVADILNAVVNAVDVPVTLKIRTGWARHAKNGLHIARMAEDIGIQALAVHGRTREDRFQGEAEYDTIAEICQAVSIPVLANGDINSAEKAREVLDYTGAKGVMIGRAAQGRPWIFREIRDYLTQGTLRPAPANDEIYALMQEHLQGLHECYGDFMGVRIARKHIGWYLQQHPQSLSHWRAGFNRLETPSSQLEWLEHLFHSGAPEARALA